MQTVFDPAVLVVFADHHHTGASHRFHACKELFERPYG
jgi:hypothetical protein